MSDNLTMRVEIVSQDQASAAIREADASFKKLLATMREHVASFAGTQKGDVLVMNHHVGVATGLRDKLGRIGMISGNHGHKVGASWENPGRILDVRRAADPAEMAERLHAQGVASRRPVHHHHGDVVVNGARDADAVARRVLAKIEADYRTAAHGVYHDV